MSFEGLGLDPRLEEAVARLGFENATPIQIEAIPTMLSGRNIIGRARTGSGKTAAFGLPLLQKVAEGGKQVQALVLAPTRELALQVTNALRDLAKKLPVRVVAIYGGTPYGPQLQALRTGATVIVATPGRLLDHLDRGNIDLSHLKVLVLDEADEMLRMGFIDDVTRVFELSPDDRQVALFSATMPDAIRRVVNKHVAEPVEVQVEEQALSVGHIEQRAIIVANRNKLECLERVLRAEPLGTHLVFARTRKGCAELADALAERGVPVDALHGDLNQSARERVLARLRAGRLNVVIATDVAARGIDVEHITHVINVDLPPDPETYVHRIGRTGRAGAEGIAISFATPSERGKIHFLSKKLKVPIQDIGVPTDGEIAQGQRRALIDQLRTTLEETDLTNIREWLRELLADSERSEHDVAAAAIHLLTERTPGGFESGDADFLPEWARRKERRKERKDERRRGEEGPGQDQPRGYDVQRSAGNNEVELFIAAGKNRGLRPGDLVGALANEIGIRGAVIGRVMVGARTTFVGLPRDVANAVLNDWDHLPFRGMKIPMLMARPPEDRPPRPGKHSVGPKKGSKAKNQGNRR